MLFKIGAAALATSILLTAGFAQTKKSTPPQTKKPPQTNQPTKGTVQLPGDNGKVGTTYQLGSKGSELHFTIDSVNVASRYLVKDEALVAGKEERLLVINFTVQNPLNQEQTLSSSSFRFTAVSPDDKNFECRGELYQTDTKAKLYSAMKPAQKTKCTVVFPIYPSGPITKLMVQRSNAPVLRYDLRDKTGKLDSVFSEDGLSLGDQYNGTLGKAFDFGGWDIEVQDVKAVESIGDYKTTADNQMFVATVKFSNPTSKGMSVGFQYFMPLLNDEDGQKIDWRSALVSPSVGSPLYQEVAPGEFIRGCYVFTGKKGQKPARLKLTFNNSNRTAVFKL